MALNGLRTLILTAAVLGGVVSVSAQSAQPSGPRVEFGAGVMALGGLVDVSDFIGDPQLGLTGLEIWATSAINPRIGFEGRFGMSRVNRVDVNVYDLSVTIRYQRPDQRTRTAFLRFGAAGHREVEDVAETVHENQDRSVIVYPAYTHYKVTPPTTGLAGIGIQQVVFPHLAIRGEFDVLVGSIGIGGRVSAGVSIPIGAYRER